MFSKGILKNNMLVFGVCVSRLSRVSRVPDKPPLVIEMDDADSQLKTAATIRAPMPAGSGMLRGEIERLLWDSWSQWSTMFDWLCVWGEGQHGGETDKLFTSKSIMTFHVGVRVSKG